MISDIDGYMSYPLTSSYRSQAESPFSKFDANEDGVLDETELASMAEELSEMTGETVEASQLMSDLDSDEDGFVSEDELEAGRPENPPPPMMMGMMPEEEESESTDPLDTNGDGVVDADEAAAGLASLIQNYADQATSASGVSGDLPEALLNLLA